MSELLTRFAALCAADPPLRADGRCAVCYGPRHLARSRRYAKGCAELDAFCSTGCARRWHGTTAEATLTIGRPRRLAA
jgi:hypothetical protein